MAPESSFKLTYATMFNPPEELHQRFDEALARLKANFGKEYGMIIDGKDVFAQEKIGKPLPGGYGCRNWRFPERQRRGCQISPCRRAQGFSGLESHPLAKTH